MCPSFTRNKENTNFAKLEKTVNDESTASRLLVVHNHYTDFKVRPGRDRRSDRPQHLIPENRAVTNKSRNRMSTFLGDGGIEIPVIYPAMLEARPFPRKEVIQPHLPVRLPCYDFTPIIDPTFDGSLLKRLGHRLRVLPTFVV